jgi:hypothetical protein
MSGFLTIYFFKAFAYFNGTKNTKHISTTPYRNDDPDDDDDDDNNNNNDNVLSLPKPKQKHDFSS